LITVDVAAIVSPPLGGGRRKSSLSAQLFATSADVQDPRRQKLITAVLDDFRRLSGEPPDAPTEKL
jgi:hypothetical protein